jgi:hypothetical protein
MRRGIGVLLAVGGAAAFMLLRRKLKKEVIHDRYSVLGTKNGRCDVVQCPEDVELSWSRNEKVRWHISNPAADGDSCDHPVRVCLKGWRLRGMPVPAPVKDVGGGRFCRPVNPRQPAAPLLAQLPLIPVFGRYSYVIEVDGHESDDPMLEIVL